MNGGYYRVVVGEDACRGVDVINMGVFDCVEKVRVTQDVVNPASAVRSPAGEVGFSWVVEGCYRNIVVA